MRLRKQLLIASFFTLSLPWVGCQYVQEMEESLLAGQSEALQASAYAVAATIENDAKLGKTLQAFSRAANARPLYLHPFYSPLILDGYNEDWESYGYQAQSFPNKRNAGFPALIYGGKRGDDAWLLFKIPSPHISYFNPGKTAVSAHRLRLAFSDAKGKLTERLILASSPGRVQVFDDNSTSIDHRINGVWREYEAGFQIELQLPFQLIEHGLSFELLQPGFKQTLYGNVSELTRTTELPKPNYLDEGLTNTLAIFEREGIRLSIASNHAANVGSSGKLGDKQYTDELPWFISLLFRLALGNKSYQNLPNPASSGYFSHSEVLVSLTGQTQNMRYTLNGQTISTVSVPITLNGGVTGAVLAEQNARSLTGFTDKAFSRLLLYSIAVSFGSALVLVIYASWLSFRVRKLSRLAAEAISETGKVKEQFSSSRLNDEIGDLSRSFAQLLSRLKEYTHYLKTLSSKLSHELRTPLAIVSSSLDNLEHEDLSPQAKVYALRAKEGTSRLSSILNSMSAASRVEQAIGNAELEPIPLDNLLNNLCAAYEDVYPQVKFGLKVQEHNSGFKLMAAGELLVQMLDKLVDNAADFCPEGGLIELGLYRQQHDLVITVRNEGPLLPQTMHKQLFDSMVSVRDSNKIDAADDHHLGLGLYIVRLIVDFHQGSVQGYNVPDNSGVIFEIRLPCL